MPVLLKKHTEIRVHWEALGAAMQTILPRSGGSYRAQYEHAVANLRCSNFPDETAFRIGGTQVTVVPLVQTTESDPPLHWLSWFEEWTEPKTRAGRRQLQFGSSSITVYYGKQSNPKRQLLRAEWTGALREEHGQEVFQAPGAAHPHWHVDGVRAYFSEHEQSLLDPIVSEGAVSEIPREPTFVIPDRAELCWTGVHLATHAQWPDNPWPGPAGPHDMHAAGPSDLLPLRNWLISCTRYLQAQIQGELLRARW